MYEVLLKWGLESFSRALGTKGEHELSLVVEAARTKNAMVERRFGFAWKACQDLVNLNIRIAGEIESLQQDTATDFGDNNDRSAATLLDKIYSRRYVEYCKIRSQFDATNDLLSAYSQVFTDLVEPAGVAGLCEEAGNCQPGEVLACYRRAWALISAVQTSLVRLTATDLRFWLCDFPYASASVEWVHRDFSRARQYLIEKPADRYWLRLESAGAADEFWDEVNDKRWSGHGA